jgi:hypothetical protein
VILNTLGNTCILVQEGPQGILIANIEILNNHKKKSELKKQLANFYSINSFEFKSIPKTPSLIGINETFKPNPSQKNQGRILLITGNPNIQLKDLVGQINDSTLLIADASNKLWKIREWEREADKLLLRFHSVSEKGPVVLENNACIFSALKN